MIKKPDHAQEDVPLGEARPGGSGAVACWQVCGPSRKLALSPQGQGSRRRAPEVGILRVPWEALWQPRTLPRARGPAKCATQVTSCGPPDNIVCIWNLGPKGVKYAAEASR